MNTNRILLAFDPGKHCGWAKLDHGAYTAGIIHGDDAIDTLIFYVKSLRLGAVVIEDFTGMQHPDRYTLLLVGRLGGACEALGIKHAIQSQQSKDPFLANAEVILGKKHTKHASDDVSALAHLMAFEYRLKS